MLTPLFATFTFVNVLLPVFLSYLLTQAAAPTLQQYHLIKSFSLLLLGMFLSSLATLNFSLALIVGVLASPLSFVHPARSPATRVVTTALLNAISPPAVLLAGAAYWGADITSVLREAAVGWHVCGTYSPVVVWCVWWPAWLAGSMVVLGRTGGPGAEGKEKTA
jgi:glycosylphosphatidylinositol transamidase